MTVVSLEIREQIRDASDVIEVIYRSRYQAEQGGMTEEEADSFIQACVDLWYGAQREAAS